MTLQKRFEKYDDEYAEFERVENKRSQRRDLHAFLLLDEIVPGDTDMVSFEQIRDLVRCCVR